MPASSQDAGRSIPKVAVIIPCYNHGKYVQEALLSVAEQDYPAKAIFISDEQSTDNSWDQILSIMDEQQSGPDGIIMGRIKGVVTLASINPNPNGPSGARNRLIKMAWPTADMFSMLDADDYYLPGKISKSVQVIVNDPEVIRIVYTDALIYHEKNGIKIREYREPYVRSRLEQECVISNTPLVTKLALEQSGLYDEEYRTAEDWNLWLRITKLGIAAHIPEALHVYRVTGRNASDVVPKEIWEKNWKKIQELIYGSSN